MIFDPDLVLALIARGVDDFKVVVQEDDQVEISFTIPAGMPPMRNIVASDTVRLTNASLCFAIVAKEAHERSKRPA